jgi:pyruvate/2-oxoglutarate/acetoin dehydrogenase E1 component
VVIPSSPEHAYGLLLAAVRDPDPVVFLEPTRIYRASKGEVEDNGDALPLDAAFILREGRDVTHVIPFDDVSHRRSDNHAAEIPRAEQDQPGTQRSTLVSASMARRH